ncbi:MAG: dTMP kinase [Gammaproteobacteria bacterium]
MSKARFITVEGTEGVGKSTHMAFIRAWLENHGVSVLQTREPGGTPLAEQIRTILLDATHTALPAMAELLLMFAARADHVEQVIRPALTQGRWVLCDRFTDASYAYQGGGRKLPARQIAVLERMVLKGLKPDLTLLLDTPVHVGLSRVQGRGSKDRFELEQHTFFERVRRTYLRRARREPRRIQVIEADGDLLAVQRRIGTVLESRIVRWL